MNLNPRLALLEKINGALKDTPKSQGQMRRDLGTLLNVVSQLVTNDESAENIRYFEDRLYDVQLGKALKFAPHINIAFGIPDEIDLSKNVAPAPSTATGVRGVRVQKRVDSIQRW